MFHLYAAVIEEVRRPIVRVNRSRTVGIVPCMALSAIFMVRRMIMTIIRRDGRHRMDSILKRDITTKTAGIMTI
jgi:hypothetical protein